jgi:hypothetical protein
MKNLCIFCATLFTFFTLSPIVVITYKEYDEATQPANVDFDLYSNTVGGIKDIGQDDFYLSDYIKSPQQITTSSSPTEQSPYQSREQFINVDVDDPDYHQYFNHHTTQKKDYSKQMDIYNRNLFQLKYLASDFTVSTDIFKKDPQVNSNIDYYINGQKIEWGERIIVRDQTFRVDVVRKDLVGFGGTFEGSTIFNITCPLGGRVEFDVTEIEQLPTYQITTKTKGCMITQR